MLKLYPEIEIVSPDCSRQGNIYVVSRQGPCSTTYPAAFPWTQCVATHVSLSHRCSPLSRLLTYLEVCHACSSYILAFQPAMRGVLVEIWARATASRPTAQGTIPCQDADGRAWLFCYG